MEAHDVATVATPKDGQARVTLRGQEVLLTRPRSYAIRSEIVGFAGLNPTRAYMAALAVCLPHLRRPKVTLERCRYDVGLFGGAVLDELMEDGHTMAELVDASHEAYQLLRSGLVTEAALKEAEGNSDAPTRSIG